MNPLAIGAAVIIAVLSIACATLWKVAGSEREARAEIQGRFDAFQADVKRLGEAQKAKNEQTLKEREKVNEARYKALQRRYSDLDARYAGLRNDKPGSGSGGLPPVPDAARPTDDAARDNRLLEVLRHADQQTATLIELQEWIKQQN